jgi:hypothetical protein
MPLLGAVAETFKAAAPALGDNPRAIAASTAQRQVLARARGLQLPPAGEESAHEAKSCAHGTPEKKRIYSCIRIVSSPGSWTPADPPAYPSSSMELEDRRCAGPALSSIGDDRCFSPHGNLQPQDECDSPSYPLMAMEARINR